MHNVQFYWCIYKHTFLISLSFHRTVCRDDWSPLTRVLSHLFFSSPTLINHCMHSRRSGTFHTVRLQNITDLVCKCSPWTTSFDFLHKFALSITFVNFLSPILSTRPNHRSKRFSIKRLVITTFLTLSLTFTPYIHLRVSIKT